MQPIPNQPHVVYSPVPNQGPNVAFAGGQVQMPYGQMGNVPVPPGAAAPMQWMVRPQPIPGCPAGLEYLTQIDRLIVQQQVELLEAFTGWETNNKYVVRNSVGQQVYYAFEKTDTCMRMCCGPRRSFVIHIVDNLNQEVLRVSRDFKCCAGCCWCAGCCDCCSHEVKIETPSGETMGYIKQDGSCCAPSYKILDDQHNSILRIQGPVCIVDGPCMPCENKFEVIGTDGTTIGKIAKQYAGFAREMFTTADTFSIEFPVDLSVKIKSALIGALFLIVIISFSYLLNSPKVPSSNGIFSENQNSTLNFLNNCIYLNIIRILCSLKINNKIISQK